MKKVLLAKIKQRDLKLSSSEAKEEIVSMLEYRIWIYVNKVGE